MLRAPSSLGRWRGRVLAELLMTMESMRAAGPQGAASRGTFFAARYSPSLRSLRASASDIRTFAFG
jgi:hypothetical protein